MIENVITNEIQIKGYENVKAIKDEIAKLRKEMVGLADDSEAQKQKAEELAHAEYSLKQVMSANKEGTSALIGSYNQLQNQLTSLRKVWKETNDESTRNAIGAQISELDAKLKGMDASVGVFTRNVGNYRSALKGLKEELMQLPKDTAEYNAKLEVAANITVELTKQQEMLKYSSTDVGAQMSNLRGIATNMVAGFSAVSAAIGMFGEQNEDLQKAMLKVQQAMAIVQGLEGMDGLMERTRGLSNALGLVKKSTVETTAATVKITTATVAEGAAMEGEAAATAGATVAQKGLNAAMKANPIGAILTSLMALVSLFLIFKDRIKGLITENETLSNMFTKIQAVFTGVGNVVKKFVMLPIQQTGIVIKTMATVAWNAIRGKFKEAINAAKQGAQELAETTMNALDVVNNYQQGVADKQKELAEKKAREDADRRRKELDEQIKDLEAKEGSEAKYLAKNKKLYDDYYKAKMDSYKKDTDEFKEAQREQWAYEQTYNNKEAETRRKASEEVQKELEKTKQDFATAFNNIVYNSLEKAYNKSEDIVKKWNELLKKQGHNELTLNFKAPAKGDIQSLNLNKYFNTFKEYIEKNLGRTLTYPIDEALKEDGDLLRERFTNGVLKDIFNDAYQLQLEALKEIDDEYKKFEAKNSLEAKQASNARILTWQDELTQETGLIDTRINLYEQQKDKLDDLIYDFQRLGSIKDSMEMMKPLYEMQTEYNRLIDNLEADRAKKISEITYKQLNRELDALRDVTSNTIKEQQGEFEKMASEWHIFDQWTIVDKKAKELNESIFGQKEKTLETIKDRLEYELQNEQYVAEQKVAIQNQLNDVMAELYDLDVERTVYANEQKKESLNKYVNAVKDMFNGLSDIYGKSADAYKMMIDTKVQTGKMTEKEAEKEFEHVKDLQVSQAIVNTLSAAIGAYQSMAGIPYVGPILGAAAAATALQYGYAQVQQIKATKYGSSSTSNNGNVPANATSLVRDYEPTMTRNMTGARETEDLANAMRRTPLFVSVTDINNAQVKVTQKDRETSF